MMLWHPMGAGYARTPPNRTLASTCLHVHESQLKAMTTIDHRTRVAAERRERMRIRLLESALLVFSEKGLDASSIEDIIAAAQVSRGTFYNYYQTIEELMVALLEVLGNELITVAEEATSKFSDPADRVSIGIRMLLRTVRAFPMLGRFVARVGIESRTQNVLAMRYAPRDVAACVEAGYFEMADIMMGVEFLSGIFTSAVYAMTTREGLPDDYPEQITYHALLGLGFTKTKAKSLIKLPAPPMDEPADSFLARAGKR
jgi:AcrR family transcriptional regulator